MIQIVNFILMSQNELDYVSNIIFFVFIYRIINSLKKYVCSLIRVKIYIIVRIYYIFFSDIVEEV